MLFSYKAKTKEGQVVESTLEAVDRYAILRELKTKGLTVLSIKEKKQGLQSIDKMVQNFFGKVKIQEQIIFTKNLSGMIKAGLSLSRAISVLQKQTKNLKFYKILESLNE